MTMTPTAENPPEVSSPKARRRFLIALGLFLIWVTFLIALGMLSATGPGRAATSVEVESSGP
jgi:hypothetical protein